MKKFSRAILLLPILALLAVSCASRTQSPQAAPTGGFMLALPRIEVGINRNGVPSIGWFSPGLIEKVTRGAVKAESLSLPRAWVDYFTSTNTQHIELMQKDDGMYVWVNGKRLPNITFDSQSLNNVRALARQTQGFEALGLSERATRLIDRAMPLVSRIGLNVLIRFPVAPEIAKLPVRSSAQRALPAAALSKQDAVGEVRVVLAYDEAGDPNLYGISEQEFKEIFNSDIMSLALEPWFVKELMKRNIQVVRLTSEGDGLAVSVNGTKMPSMQCDADCLGNLGAAFGALNTYPQHEHLNAPIAEFAPYLRKIDADITLRFPAAPGAAPVEIPAK